MSWALLLLLFPIAALIWAMVLVIRANPHEGHPMGGYLQLANWMVFLILYVLRKVGLITWPEVVIFMLCFYSWVVMFLRSRIVSRQLAELKGRLAELEKIAGIPQTAVVPTSEKAA